jgi:putative Holliday junction resolvase
MGRLLAIDYGKKRTGLAVTDPAQIIANPLTTVPTHEIWQYLKDYFNSEEVEAVIIGLPQDLFGNDSHSTAAVNEFVKTFGKKFPQHTIHLHDERYTSKMALDAMIRGGSTKADRKKKENIDKISAAIILQSFMEAQNYKR